MENCTIKSEMDFAKVGLVVQRRGRVEVPLQDVRMRVFGGWTKNPRDAPMILIVLLQRKSRSGRKTQEEMLLK